jgi:hypothetical protein
MNLKLTGDEIEMLTQERDDAGLSLAGFPNPEEVLRVLDLRMIAASKAGKQRGGIPDGGFDIDLIKPGMSKEVSDRARQEILKHMRTT